MSATYSDTFSSSMFLFSISLLDFLLRKDICNSLSDLRENLAVLAERLDPILSSDAFVPPIILPHASTASSAQYPASLHVATGPGGDGLESESSAALSASS